MVTIFQTFLMIPNYPQKKVSSFLHMFPTFFDGFPMEKRPIWQPTSAASEREAVALGFRCHRKGNPKIETFGGGS